MNRRHQNSPFIGPHPSSIDSAAETDSSQANSIERIAVHNWPVRVSPRSWVANVALVLVTIFVIVLIYALAQPPAEIARAATGR